MSPMALSHQSPWTGHNGPPNLPIARHNQAEQAWGASDIQRDQRGLRSRHTKKKEKSELSRFPFGSYLLNSRMIKVPPPEVLSVTLHNFKYNLCLLHCGVKLLFTKIINPEWTLMCLCSFLLQLLWSSFPSSSAASVKNCTSIKNNLSYYLS